MSAPSALQGRQGGHDPLYPRDKSLETHRLMSEAKTEASAEVRAKTTGEEPNQT